MVVESSMQHSSINAEIGLALTELHTTPPATQAPLLGKEGSFSSTTPAPTLTPAPLPRMERGDSCRLLAMHEDGGGGRRHPSSVRRESSPAPPRRCAPPLLGKEGNVDELHRVTHSREAGTKKRGGVAAAFKRLLAQPLTGGRRRTPVKEKPRLLESVTQCEAAMHDSHHPGASRHPSSGRRGVNSVTDS